MLLIKKQVQDESINLMEVDLMKKALAVFLIALAAVTSVFANGGSESTSGDGTTTLTWAVWDYATTPYYDALINAYEAANPDVNIEVIDLGSADYQTALQIQLSGGGSDFDVVAVKDIPGYNNLVKAGLLQDLTPLAERDGVDTAAYGGIVEQVSVDGKFYELPFRSDFWVIFYNKDLFDAAGVPYPDNDMTFEEYDQIARAVTSGSGASKVYGAHYHTWRSAIQLFGILDGQHQITDGGDYSYLKPYYEMALAQQADGIVQDYATLKTSNIHYTGVFYNQSVAMMNMGSWFIASLIAANQSGQGDAQNRGIGQYPHAEGVEPGTTLGTITALAIPTGTDQTEAAWDFVKFVCGTEGAEALAATGNFPAVTNDEINNIIASMDGFPQDEQSKEALNVAQLYLEMPLHDKSAEIEVVLNEFHDQIMTGNMSVDDGLAERFSRFPRRLNLFCGVLYVEKKG